jgi:hypothetical protein
MQGKEVTPPRLQALGSYTSEVVSFGIANVAVSCISELRNLGGLKTSEVEDILGSEPPRWNISRVVNLRGPPHFRAEMF